MIESSGARAIPIRWNSSRRIVEFLLNSVNGVLIPGNYSSDLLQDPKAIFSPKKTHFRSLDETAFYILMKAFEFNENNIHFPVLMVDYGFQFVILNLSRNRTIINDISAEKYSSTLILKADGKNNEISSLVKLNSNLKKLSPTAERRMFKYFDQKELQMMSTNKTVFFDTNIGVLLKDFYQNKDLLNYMIPTTFAVDRNGSMIVSSFEFKNYPFYGIQFQIDKIAYTLNEEEDIPHTPENIQINRKFADFFVEESKKNYQKFTDKRSEYKLVMEHFKLRYDYKLHRYIHILKETDDEYDNVKLY